MGQCRNKPATSKFLYTDFLTSEMKEVGDHMLLLALKHCIVIYTVYNDGQIRFISKEAFIKCLDLFNLKYISNVKIHQIDDDCKIDYFYINHYTDLLFEYACCDINYLKQDVINYLKIVGKK